MYSREVDGLPQMDWTGMETVDGGSNAKRNQAASKTKAGITVVPTFTRSAMSVRSWPRGRRSAGRRVSSWTS